MKIVPILLAAALMPIYGQEIKLPASLDKLADKAEQTVDVTLDGSLLKLAGRFLGNTSDEAALKKTLSGLESIAVRSFEFAHDGQYDPADVAAVRDQLKTPQWARIVGVTSKRDGENVDVYFKDGGNGVLGGIVVICAEPRSLTIVNIVGNLDPSQLADLSGQFGIPNLDLAVSIHGKKDAK
jgi:hypothetical protein